MTTQFSLPLDPTLVQTVSQQAGLNGNTIGTLGTSNPYINFEYVKANTALNVAYTAWNTANVGNTFVNTGGTVKGGVVITGNLTVLGNSTSFATSSIETNDSLILLSTGNYYSDTIDIGIVGHYNAGSNAHSGIIRDPSLKEWIFFQGYTPEISSNNLININHSSFAYANVYANTFKGNLIATTSVVNGLELYNYSTASYAQANVTAGGLVTANANSVAINGKMQSAYNQANTGTVLAQAAFNSANNVAPQIQPAFNQANTGLILAQASFDYANSRQNIQSTASPTFNSLSLTNALAISQGGTGATSQGAALTSLLPTGTSAGYVLTTGGPGSFYWAAGGGGGSGGATPGTTISSTRTSSTGTGSTTQFSTPVYVAGASQLRVYINGVRQFASEYTETSGNTAGSGIVTFTTAPASGSPILFEVDGYTNNPYYANNITYSVNATIGSTANTIQLAIDGLTSIAALKSGTTFTSPVMGPTASIGVANTQLATTAFVSSFANSGITFATGLFSNYATVGTGVSLAPSSVNGFGAGQIYDVTTGFSAPGIAMGSGTGSHGAIVYGSGQFYFGTENGSASGTMTSRATLTNAGVFSVTGSFSGAGTGLTGTAASLNIGGSAGSVSASNITGTIASTQLNAFPSGTALLFQQTAAPTGWTKVTTYNDYALRVVNGTVGTGGSVAFSAAFASKSVSGTTDATTLSTTQIPSHTHWVSSAAYDDGNGSTTGSSNSQQYGLWADAGGYSSADPNSAYGRYTLASGGGGSHTHTFTGTAINLAVNYVDVIIATKN